MDKSTGNGHTLLLTAGEVAAFFANDGIQTVRHGGQIAHEGAVPQGLLHLLVGKRLTHSDKSVTLRMYTHADKESRKRASDIVRDSIKEDQPQDSEKQNAG